MSDTPTRNGIRGLFRGSRLVPCLLLLSVFACLAVPAYSVTEAEEEIQMGKTSALEVAKEYKFIDDPALVKRLETVGNPIAKIAREKEVPATYGKSTVAKFDYTFKIIDDKEVNAFALPGGYVYVNKALLEYVHSDDELAGVIAHEIAHAAHHHIMQLIKAQQKENTALALAVLVGVAVGAKGESLENIAYALTLIRIARMSAYGQDAEFDADRTAVAYMAATKYNPVGMLTFMERFATDEARKPQRDYGLFQTHPESNKRAQVIIGEIEKRGLPINRRLVTTYTAVQVKPVPDSQASSVWIGDTEIIRLADSGSEKASIRANRIAARLTSALLAGASLRDVKVGVGDQNVIIMGDSVVEPTAEDAALVSSTVPQVTRSSADAIRRALLNEILQRTY